MNPITEECWTEFRKSSEMMDGVDGVNVILTPSAPRVADPTLYGAGVRRGKEFEDVLAGVKKKYPKSTAL